MDYVGNPGYVIGAPIQGIHNKSQEKLLPRIWHTSLISESSDCTLSFTKSIGFLDNSQSSCLLPLSRDNFTDCNQLREQVRRIQAELIESADLLIAKGAPASNPNDDDNFPITFEDFSTAMTNNSTESGAILFCSVPSHLHVEVTYSNTSSLYRINGFKINYFPEKWTWICHSTNKHCEKTKKYQLKSTVQFIHIPVAWHYQNTSKFWILQNLHNCDGDKCWRELFYPFSGNSNYHHGDQVEYAARCALLLLLAAIFLLIFLNDLY